MKEWDPGEMGHCSYVRIGSASLFYTRDWYDPDIAALFTDDGVFGPAEQRCQGKTQIETFYRARLANPRRTTRHVWSNVQTRAVGENEVIITALLTNYAFEPDVSETDLQMRVGDVTCRCVRDKNGHWLFTDQLYAALKLIDRGVLSPGTRGSMHGEIGQTQFMPKNILAYGTGNLDVAANALNSTANFLRAHGWRAGAGYQPGEANFAAIQAWNAAGVYQKAIALMGRQIDGGSAAAE